MRKGKLTKQNLSFVEMPWVTKLTNSCKMWFDSLTCLSKRLEQGQKMCAGYPCVLLIQSLFPLPSDLDQ